MPSEHNPDGYIAHGIINHCGNCNVDYQIVPVELTRDGRLFEEFVHCPGCSRAFGAQQVLDAGQLDDSEQPNYIMTDPGNYSEPFHAGNDRQAILHMIRWAEIDGHPYTGYFELHRLDGGDEGEHLYTHESERKEETD